jgi:chromosomal replication initiation ATPase DnaA
MNRSARFLDARQLALPLEPRPALAREDFIVSTCNQAAARLIDEWPRWPFGQAAAIVGPPHSGKSHLARVLATKASGQVVSAATLTTEASTLSDATTPVIVVEDVGLGVAERPLLHLFNATLERGGAVLLTACEPPARWQLSLPDLASRLRLLYVAEILEPDDALRPILLAKLFADRQLGISVEAIDYLVPRIGRSFEALGRVVDRLDAAALRAGRALTISLIRAVLSEPAPPYDEPMKS